MNIAITHFAAIGSWQDVANLIQDMTKSINNMLSGIIDVMGDNTLYEQVKTVVVGTDIAAAIKSIALTLVTLFFVIDFVHKSLDLKWVTWENVMMFFLKIVIAKLCVDNAAWLMDCVYKGFNSLVSSISPGEIMLIPQGNGSINDLISGTLTGEMTPEQAAAAMQNYNGSWKPAYEYFLSAGDVQKIIDNPHVKWYEFGPVLLMLLVTIQGLIMKGILAVTLVIILARLMELAIYTLAAPIPLATLGCDGLQDVGKGYLKSYAACCIHAMVILAIFTAYVAINTALNSSNYTNMFGLGGFMGLIKSLVLGGAIMKSEQWAKRICGAM